jgi:hypothetical protein
MAGRDAPVRALLQSVAGHRPQRRPILLTRVQGRRAPVAPALRGDRRHRPALHPGRRDRARRTVPGVRPAVRPRPSGASRRSCWRRRSAAISSARSKGPLHLRARDPHRPPARSRSSSETRSPGGTVSSESSTARCPTPSIPYRVSHRRQMAHPRQQHAALTQPPCGRVEQCLRPVPHRPRPRVQPARQILADLGEVPPAPGLLDLPGVRTGSSVPLPVQLQAARSPTGRPGTRPPSPTPAAGPHEPAQEPHAGREGFSARSDMDVSQPPTCRPARRRGTLRTSARLRVPYGDPGRRGGADRLARR